MGPLRHPGERPGPGPDAPRGHDRRHTPTNLDRNQARARSQPALRLGEPRELGWAATFLASPYGRFISGHSLVVDGANWQRRHLTNPDVVTVRDQLGRDPYKP
jgi:NAD(P)-dependent dehydrogenase (short-subunit alcohol dehydrogenase family)